MRVYAHWVPTTGRDTAARVDAIYGEPEKETAPKNQGGKGQASVRGR
jgi:hypothetical protein